MDLVVLGSSATYPGPGRACSGFLVRAGGSRVVVDLGPGTLSNLQHFVDPRDLSALVLSHLHPDHFLDLYPLRYLLEYGGRPDPLPVYAPSGALDRVSALQPDSRSAFDTVFSWHALEDGLRLGIGAAAFSFAQTEHAVEGYAMRIESGQVIAYSSDSGLSAKLGQIARDADLFIAEATWQEVPADRSVGHLSAAEAGEIAAEAGAKRLMLSHIWPTLDAIQSQRQAEKTFGPSVLLAVEGMTIVL